MERLPPTALLSTGSRASRDETQTSSVTWVPNEEVNNCPLCNRTFSAIFRRHHCRACGRVVCGTCSYNTLPITGPGKKDRVCDPCFDRRRHDQTATLADDQSNMTQVEQSLKSDLKLKHQQAEWFQGFLIRIAADAPRVAADASRNSSVASAAPAELPQSGASSPRSPTGSFCFDDEGAELQTQIATARRRWKDVCDELRRREAETAGLQRDCEQLEKQCRTCQANSQELQRQINSMQSDLKERPKVEVERDELLFRTQSLEQELGGLSQRKASLEATRPSPPGSFLSSFSSGSGAGSFVRFQERVGACANRCHQQ